MILESVKDTEDIHSLLTMIQEENTLAFNMFYEMYYDQVFRYTSVSYTHLTLPTIA